MFIYSFLILNLECWGGEKHGIIYFGTIIILSIMGAILAVTTLLFIQSLLLLIYSLIADTSRIWFI